MDDNERQALLDDVIRELDARIDSILDDMQPHERESCFDAAGEVFAYLAQAELAPTLHFGEMLCGDTLITPHWWIEVAVSRPGHDQDTEAEKGQRHLIIDPTAKHWLPDIDGVESVQRLRDLNRTYKGKAQLPEGLATSTDLISSRHILSDGLVQRFKVLTGKKIA